MLPQIQHLLHPAEGFLPLHRGKESHVSARPGRKQIFFFKPASELTDGTQIAIHQRYIRTEKAADGFAKKGIMRAAQHNRLNIFMLIRSKQLAQQALDPLAGKFASMYLVFIWKSIRNIR